MVNWRNNRYEFGSEQIMETGYESCLITFWHPRERRIAALHVEAPVTGVAEQHVVLQRDTK